MKPTKILILCIGLSLAFASCKKETVEPTPQNQNTNPPANTEVSVQISLMELTDNPGTFSASMIQVLDESGNVDTTIALAVDTTVAMSSFPAGNYCDMSPTIGYTTVSKSLPVSTNFYRIVVLNNSVPVRTLKITNNNVVDEGETGVLKICTYSPHKVMVVL